LGKKHGGRQREKKLEREKTPLTCPGSDQNQGKKLEREDGGGGCVRWEKGFCCWGGGNNPGVEKKKEKTKKKGKVARRPTFRKKKEKKILEEGGYLGEGARKNRSCSWKELLAKKKKIIFGQKRREFLGAGGKHHAKAEGEKRGTLKTRMRVEGKQKKKRAKQKFVKRTKCSKNW